MRHTYVLQLSSSTRGVVLLQSRTKALLCRPRRCALVYKSRADEKIARTDILGAALARIIYDERGVAGQVTHRLEQTLLFLACHV